MDRETTMHDEAIRAAAEAARATSGGQPFTWENAARAAITAFLERVEVSDATVAAIQRSEEWSSFWSPDDAAALFRAMLAQLRREITP